jgi:hypothetical protein
MPIINKGTAFSNGEQLTADKINNLLELATFNQSAADSASTTVNSASQIVVADSGITTAKLATDAVETAKIKDANVTFAKLADVIDDDTMATATATTLATSESIKAYVDSTTTPRSKFITLTGGTHALNSGNLTAQTLTWNIADFTSSDVDFDTTKITTIVIEAFVGDDNENASYITVTLPNNTETFIAYSHVYGFDNNKGKNSATYNLPINENQGSFDLRFSGGTSNQAIIKGAIIN